MAAFPIRKTDFGEREQLFRRIFDQPRRIRAAPEPERIEKSPREPSNRAWLSTYFARTIRRRAAGQTLTIKQLPSARG